jgi:hypothetical protein
MSAGAPSKSASGPKDKHLGQVCERLFLLGLLAAVLFVLWLPVFPTGDGPVHLYYADVLWSLVRHQPTYAHDYAIRHLFAPYLVHYLALVSFEHFVAPAMAEKLFIAIIFLTQAFGFRFLARRLGGHAASVPIACLWMLPLLFSWSLGGGFLNCCFATGVALWAYGVWTLLGSPGRVSRTGPLLAYALSLAVLVLSHPVPLLVLLLFTASDLLLRVAGRERWQSLGPQAVAFAMTCMAFVAPVILAQKGQAAAVVPEIGFHWDVLQELLLGMRLGLFAGLTLHTFSGWLALAARAGLLAMVPGVALLLLKSKPQQPLLHSPAERLLLISLIFLAATVFFPRSLNHSYFFPQRLWDIVWLLVLASGAAARPGTRALRWMAAGAVALIALTAMTGLPALARIARAQQELAAAPLPPGKRGLFLEPDSAEEGRGAATTYPVYAWAGARAFEASHAILLNSPWLGLTILPVRDASVPGARPLLDIGLPSIYSESPLALTHALAAPSAERTAILARADFLLYSNPASLDSARPAEDTRRAALALLGDESAAWHCEAPGFYAVCVRAR